MSFRKNITKLNKKSNYALSPLSRNNPSFYTSNFQSYISSKIIQKDNNNNNTNNNIEKNFLSTMSDFSNNKLNIQNSKTNKNFFNQTLYKQNLKNKINLSNYEEKLNLIKLNKENIINNKIKLTNDKINKKNEQIKLNEKNKLQILKKTQENSKKLEEIHKLKNKVHNILTNRIIKKCHNFEKDINFFNDKIFEYYQSDFYKNLHLNYHRHFHSKSDIESNKRINMIIDLNDIKKKNDLVENIDFNKTFSTKEKRLIQLEPSYYFKDFSKFTGLKNFTLKTLKEKINEEEEEKLKYNKIEKQKKLKELEDKLKIRKKRRRKDVSNFDVVLINTFINDDVDSNNETTEENEENLKEKNKIKNKINLKEKNKIYENLIKKCDKFTAKKINESYEKKIKENNFFNYVNKEIKNSFNKINFLKTKDSFYNNKNLPNFKKKLGYENKSEYLLKLNKKNLDKKPVSPQNLYKNGYFCKKHNKFHSMDDYDFEKFSDNHSFFNKNNNNNDNENNNDKNEMKLINYYVTKLKKMYKK